MTFCYRCGRPLTTDEIGLNRKMIDRSAQRFLCKSCFAAYFGVSEEKVDVGEGSSFVMKRTISYSNGNKYEGEVSLSGERSGYGSLIMVNGDKYEGEWANDVKHGHGVEVWATGARYEGEWKDGKKDGEGILTGRGGIKSKQVWENGKLISQEPIRKE